MGCAAHDPRKRRLGRQQEAFRFSRGRQVNPQAVGTGGVDAAHDSSNEGAFDL